MNNQKIEIADHVHHKPSGENWVVARVNQYHLWPAGWPPCRAYVEDCELIHKATPEQVQNMLRDLRNLPGYDERKAALGEVSDTVPSTGD